LYNSDFDLKSGVELVILAKKLNLAFDFTQWPLIAQLINLKKKLCEFFSFCVWCICNICFVID